jgi:Fe-S-cluster containining protein
MWPDQDAFREYQALLRQLNLKSAQLSALHSSNMRCAKGCHSCCQPDLSVTAVEAEHIKAWIAAQPGLLEKLEALAKADPWKGSRCALLDAEGSCSIYDVRPVICRSHGFPIRFAADNAEVKTDVCPLNFNGTPIEDLASDAVIDIDKLNTLLAVINIRFDQEKSERRTPLHPDALG